MSKKESQAARYGGKARIDTWRLVFCLFDGDALDASIKRQLYTLKIELYVSGARYFPRAELDRNFFGTLAQLVALC